MFYLLHLLLSLLPLQLLIVSLVTTFQRTSPQHRAPESIEEMYFVHQQQEKKRS